MLNTYRVISLSLVTALFFAAPLLCVQPISFQIKKARYTQAKGVRVVAKRAATTPQIKTRDASAAWARSIHPTGYKTLHGEEPVSTEVGDESWDENYRSDWQAAEEEGGIGTMGTASYSDLLN
ncbi:MAG: hypothetical protein P8075_01880 [Deltaproteobacteria bacterium]|jgi:hypothetical protein